MQTLLRNVNQTTEDFNLLGKILTWAVLSLVVILAASLLVGLALELINGRSVNFSY